MLERRALKLSVSDFSFAFRGRDWAQDSFRV